MKKLPVEVTYTCRVMTAKTNLGPKPVVFVEKWEEGRTVETYTVTFGANGLPRCNCKGFRYHYNGTNKVCRHGDMAQTQIILAGDVLPITAILDKRAQVLADRKALWD